MAKYCKNTESGNVANVISDIAVEIKEMKEEREQFYEQVREIEKLKQDFLKLEDEEAEKIVGVEEVLSILTATADSHPGIKIFKKKLRSQCFTIGINLLSTFEKNGFDYEDVMFLLRSKLLGIETLSEETACELFYVMSLENDELVCNSCYELLINLCAWSPEMRDVFNVFLNWGATLKTLGLTDHEKSIIFLNDDSLKPCSVTNKNFTTFYACSLNFQKIFSYITEVMKRSNTYTEEQIIIFLKCILKIALDKKFGLVVTNLKNCIVACIESIRNWDSFKITNISALVHNSTDHFHNQAALVMDIIPKLSKCNDLSSCLSLTVLRIMINSEVKYIYPFTDEVVLDLVKSVKVNVNNGEDLYKLYIIIHLLNHMVYHRNMTEVNQTVLNDLKSTVDILKWKVAKSKRTFDADLLKSRISYCSALWSLFRRNKS